MEKILKNCQEIKYGGLKVFLLKLKSLLHSIIGQIFVVALLPVVIFLIIIKPIFFVRIGHLRSERIGHFAADVEAFLCASSINSDLHKSFDIYFCNKNICNMQLFCMWRRVIRIYPGVVLWKALIRGFEYCGVGKTHVLNVSNLWGSYKLFTKNTTHIQFTPDEEMKGFNLLTKIGMRYGSPWVCIHNRDSKYLEAKFPYSNFRYQDYRNFSVESFKATAVDLSSKGFFVIRIGNVVEEKISFASDRVIDLHDTGYDSDFAVLYLLSKCVLYLGSDSGVACVPKIFGLPVSYINYSLTQLYVMVEQNSYKAPFITKHLWCKNRMRLISLKEIFELGLEGATETSDFERVGVVPISNSQDEVRALANENLQRMDGTWLSTTEDIELQIKIWNIYKKYSKRNSWDDIKVLFGADFLRASRYLFYGC